MSEQAVEENATNILKEQLKGEAEKFEFEAEVPQILSLLIGNVYSSKDMFLRELISNASDAISKLKSRKNELDSQGYATANIGSYKIQIIPDKNNNTLTIKDNGVGMTRSDLISFLGNIASSGTKKFKELLNSKNDRTSLDSLIGQFGLGFYSAFLVAERVDVITKSPMDEGYLWSSNGGNAYEIRKCDAGDMQHGTSVVLTLKEGETEYLESSRLIGLIKKHSLYIRYPIAVLVEKEEEEKEEEAPVEEVKEDENEPKIEPESTDTPKKVKKVIEEQIINTEVPVWNKKVEDVPEEDLKKFYKSISNDYDDYAAVQSWHFEGIINLKILLFIPKRAKLGFFEQNTEKNRNIKVFSSNVFVTDDLGKEVVPDWMNFVVGAVSSSDFPMNISREFLQGKSVLNLLKNKLPKCIAEMIKKLEKDSEKYNAFYKEFAQNIKLAVRHYTDTQQETFAKFLRYSTNQDNSASISFDEYLEKVGEDQKQILFLTGLTKKDVETSLCLEAFKDRLVLLMPEAVDEIMLQGLKKYKEHDLQNISMEGVDSVNPVSEDAKKEYTSFTDKIKEILKDKIDNVVVSNRFACVPASILTTKYGNSSTMENILKAQPGVENNPMLMMMLKSKKIFEINIDSPVIQQLKKMFDEDKNEQVSTYVNFLYSAALVGSGFTLDDKATFIKDLYSILHEAVASK